MQFFKAFHQLCQIPCSPDSWKIAAVMYVRCIFVFLPLYDCIIIRFLTDHFLPDIFQPIPEIIPVIIPFLFPCRSLHKINPDLHSGFQLLFQPVCMVKVLPLVLVVAHHIQEPVIYPDFPILIFQAVFQPFLGFNACKCHNLHQFIVIQLQTLHFIISQVSCPLVFIPYLCKGIRISLEGGCYLFGSPVIWFQNTHQRTEPCPVKKYRLWIHAVSSLPTVLRGSDI